MAQFQAVNNDTVIAVAGDIVKSSGQVFGVVRAQATSATIALLGAWETGAAIGGTGTVKDDLVEVNCEVSVSIGSKLYLSASTPGKATNIPPAYPYFLGVVLDKRTFGGVQKATVILHNQGCVVSDTGMGVLVGVPATGTINVVSVANLVDNDRFVINDGVHSAIQLEYQVTPSIKATGTITCVAKTNILDNEGFTLNDGVNPATPFEYQITPNVYATGTLTAVAKASLIDNETFTLNDGVNPATVFEFKKTADVYATGTLTAVAKASLIDNETFTLNDGVNAATVFELHVKDDIYATGSITCPAKASILNNETVTLDDGVNPHSIIEFKAYADAYATGSITAVAKANLLDNETFTLNDGVNAATVFEFQKTPDVYSTGSIEVVDYTKLVDNDTFSIGDGINEVTFEIDVSGAYVPTQGFIPVHINGLATDALVAGAIKDAINGVTTGLTVTAGTVVVSTVPLTNDAYGPFNVAVTNGAAVGALTCTGLTGGSVFTPTGGAVVVCDITAVATADDVATTMVSTINGVIAGLAITAGAPTGAVIPLTNDAYGFYNTAITDTVFDAGFTHTGMTGGAIWTATGAGVVVCDITGDTTNAQVAATLKSTIDGIVADLAITCGAITVATIALTNDAYGAYNNAITDTVSSGLLTHTGMSGGEATSYVAGGGTVVDVRGDTTAAQVAATIKAAINGVVAGLAITAGTITDATIALANDAYGAYNTAITDTVVNAGFTHTGMSGGSISLFTPSGGGVVVCDVTGDTTAAQVAATMKSSINGVVAGLAITAGTIADATIALANDAYGAYNTAITDTVANAGFIHTGMTGGSVFTPAGGLTEVIDITGATTAAQVATATKAKINAVVATLAITAGTITNAKIELQNDAYGAYNTAITDTVTHAGFIHTGMTGGSVFTGTGGYTQIELYNLTDTTATGVAVATAAAIMASSPNFIIPTPTSAAISITNTVPGTGGNVATTEAVTAAGFTVTGMSGGVDPIA
jgi:hypothetical protein